MSTRCFMMRFSGKYALPTGQVNDAGEHMPPIPLDAHHLVPEVSSRPILLDHRHECIDQAVETQQRHHLSSILLVRRPWLPKLLYLDYPFCLYSRTWYEIYTDPEDRDSVFCLAM